MNGFYKEIELGSWAEKSSQPFVSFVPVSSGGLTANDAHGFFQKTAASEKFVEVLNKEKLGKGEVPLHVNAIGATNFVGSNRKGDAFNEDTCKKYHHRFVKDAKVYVQHRNKDPKQNYGRVIASDYNDKMHRIELLLSVNTNQRVAEKNGGLVLPDSYLEKIEKNAEIPVSMACYVEKDVCSHCGHGAKGWFDYCDEDTCLNEKTGEYGLGCKHALGKTMSNGEVQYVENVDPHFFDISVVRVPADRTGFGFVADYAKKEASFEKTAEDILSIESSSVDTFRKEDLIAVIKEAALYERSLEPQTQDFFLAYGYTLPDDIVLGEKLASFSTEKKYGFLADMASQGVILSPEAFAKAFRLSKEAALDIRLSSHGVYERMLKASSYEVPQSILTAMDYYRGRYEREDFAPYCVDFAKTASYARRGSLTNIALMNEAERNYLPQGESYAAYKAAAVCLFPHDLKKIGIKAAILKSLDFARV